MVSKQTEVNLSQNFKKLLFACLPYSISRFCKLILHYFMKKSKFYAKRNAYKLTFLLHLDFTFSFGSYFYNSPFKFYLQTFLFFVDKSLTFLTLNYTTPHTISTSIVTLILLFSTRLTLFLPFISKLTKSSKAVNSTIVSNLLDIAPSNIPRGSHIGCR